MAKSYKKIDKYRKQTFFKKRMEETGDLACEYCGQSDLIISHKQDPEIPRHRRATLDHYLSVALGGSRLDRNNWRVACERCNNEKSKVESYLKRRK